MIEISELTAKLEELSKTSNVKAVRDLEEDVQPIDFAEAIEKLEDAKIILKVFRMLDTEEAAEVFTYFEPETQEMIITAFSSGEVKEIVEELYSDDLVDVIDEMPAELVKKILKTTTPQKRVELNEILKYEEETAGGMMTVNFIEIKVDSTVEQAIETIRKVHEEYETIDDLYVTDEYGSVKGWLEFRELVFHSSNAKISEVMNADVVSVSIDTDQEEVAQMFKRYDVDTMPVIDNKNKLVGIITVDDVIDVLDKEVTEDMAKLAGISKIEENYFETGIFRMAKSRSIWLMAMLILGTIAQILIIVLFNAYGVKDTLDPKLYFGVMYLSPMLLVIAAVAGISGNQSATMMVRSLSLHEIKRDEISKIILKEFIVSLIISIALIAINVVRLIIIYAIQNHGLETYAWKAIGTSSLAILIAVVFANLIGCLLPLVARGLKLDPTIAASPLVTTIVDIVAVAAFLGIGLALA